MALGPVAHHVEQRVAMVDESVQVGQGASGGSHRAAFHAAVRRPRVANTTALPRAAWLMESMCYS